MCSCSPTDTSHTFANKKFCRWGIRGWIVNCINLENYVLQQFECIWYNHWFLFTMYTGPSLRIIIQLRLNVQSICPTYIQIFAQFPPSLQCTTHYTKQYCLYRCMYVHTSGCWLVNSSTWESKSPTWKSLIYISLAWVWICMCIKCMYTNKNLI